MFTGCKNECEMLATNTVLQANIHLVSITLPSALQGRQYRPHVTVKNLLEQRENNLPRALEGSLPDSGVDSVIPTPDVFPGHHPHKQNEDPTPEKAKT